MADQWYFAWDNHKFGPFSATQLRELAEQGRIQPTDTVWNGESGPGVPAAKVRNLFASLPAPDLTAADSAGLPQPTVIESPAPPRPADPSADAPDALPDGLELKAIPEDNAGGVTAAPVPEGEEQAPAKAPAADAEAPAARKQRVMKARAVAVKGAVILSQQDGSVRFRKKCTTCGHVDSSASTLPIRNGTTRVNYFCPKCRKPREVVLQGSMQPVLV